MIKLKNWFLFTLSFLFISIASYSQNFASNEAEYDSIYAVNIQLSKINGVYIPKNLAEAHNRLLKLSPKASMEKFQRAPEEEVCRKVHFGIGRWMIVNWNFYEGSRLSHFLKRKGMSHPDDMAQYVLRTLHRKLNNMELNEKQIAIQLLEERKIEVDSVYKN